MSIAKVHKCIIAQQKRQRPDSLLCGRDAFIILLNAICICCNQSSRCIWAQSRSNHSNRALHASYIS